MNISLVSLKMHYLAYLKSFGIICSITFIHSKNIYSALTIIQACLAIGDITTNKRQKSMASKTYILVGEINYKQDK